MEQHDNVIRLAAARPRDGRHPPVSRPARPVPIDDLRAIFAENRFARVYRPVDLYEGLSERTPFDSARYDDDDRENDLIVSIWWGVWSLLTWIVIGGCIWLLISGTL